MEGVSAGAGGARPGLQGPMAIELGLTLPEPEQGRKLLGGVGAWDVRPGGGHG